MDDRDGTGEGESVDVEVEVIVGDDVDVEVFELEVGDCGSDSVDVDVETVVRDVVDVNICVGDVVESEGGDCEGGTSEDEFGRPSVEEVFDGRTSGEVEDAEVVDEVCGCEVEAEEDRGGEVEEVSSEDGWAET